MSQGKFKSSTQNSKRKHNQQRAVWPIWLILGGLVVVVPAVFAFRGKDSNPKANIEVRGSSSLQADTEKIDLGDVKLGKTVEVSFQLSNVGDKTLEFTKAPYIEVVEGC